MIDDATIVELREMLAKATPGPWRAGDVEAHNVFGDPYNPAMLAPGLGRVVLQANRHYPDAATEDAKLVAALRNQAGPLLDLVDRLAREFAAEHSARCAAEQREADLAVRLAANTAAHDQARATSLKARLALEDIGQGRNKEDATYHRAGVVQCLDRPLGTLDGCGDCFACHARREIEGVEKERDEAESELARLRSCSGRAAAVAVHGDPLAGAVGPKR